MSCVLVFKTIKISPTPMRGIFILPSLLNYLNLHISIYRAQLQHSLSFCLCATLKMAASDGGL